VEAELAADEEDEVAALAVERALLEPHPADASRITATALKIGTGS